MKKFHFEQPEDFLALLVRRKWWLATSAILILGGIIFVVALLPDIYVSKTLILVEPREVPEDFVKDLINISTEDRLDAIQKIVLSRSNLLRIIDQFGDELIALHGLDEEQKVKKLGDQIQIEMGRDRPGAPTISYFEISYGNERPGLAQRITERLTQLFIEYDNKSREARVFGTTQFLESELDNISVELRQAESELRILKERYRYELPEQLETNLRTLDRLQIQLQSSTEALDRAISLRLSMEKQLAEISSIEDFTGTNHFNGQALPSFAAAYRKKKGELQELLGRYTQKHPDVQRLTNELAALRERIPPEDPAEGSIEGSASSQKLNPIFQNLVAQLEEVRTEIGIREREQNWIRRQIEEYTRRVENTPQREQEIAEIQRSHKDLSQRHEDLNQNLAEAKLAGSLESKQKGTQFVIVDPASYPSKPSKPNRAKLLLAGLFVSLVFGFGVAFATDFADQKLWTQREVEKLFGVPVLAEIPEIPSGEELRRRHKRKIVLLGSLFIVTGLLIGGVSFLMLSPEWNSTLGREWGELKQSLKHDHRLMPFLEFLTNR